MKLGKVRLDDQLVSLGLAETKTKAQALVLAGQVELWREGRWIVQWKAGHPIASDSQLRVLQPDHDVGRGAKKLRGALRDFGLDLKGLSWALDVGASTGGFTQVLLEEGLSDVVSLDVGTHQLHERLRRDPRVHVFEQTHVLQIDSAFWQKSQIPLPFDLAVMDVSFIGVRKILDHVHSWLKPQACFLVLVKPQFELGPDFVVGGIVEDPDLQQKAVDDVEQHVRAKGLYSVRGRVPSQIRGAEGNQEFFLWLEARPVHAKTG
jgi:23S rRNA (cytidine1920-2'-O)/16S rRNA (cytidine1409-2'-O)-methyltransferase